MKKKSKLGGAAVCSTAIFSFRGAARREEGGLWEGERREGKLVVWFGGARRSGFYRLAREHGGMARADHGDDVLGC